ncbi:class I SAM-dependent methyltransferase [Klenkia brasiliensis]|uniref:Methyltransferase domain-containing protein n=1 Tax=Klenkia brasiliensis TaxID=333142 RepID=A0A1G7XU56_9ACTN|nr:class I SAM-dependent methyltransferase [Klenkia brasiliensis]SDG87709.1 Methyltransferase domain-containing protein [Klenkia brasiliensis]
MVDLSDVFWLAHTGLPREAPGSRRTTELLLALAGPLPDRPRVLDAGCGTGPASVLLAGLTGGDVTAVDLHAPFLAAVAERARAAGVADRVHPLRASIDALPLAPGTVDLVWAEGSAYTVGVDAALAGWRPLLAPGGAVVLTECGWTTAAPAPGARAFWDRGYPAMRSTAGDVEAFRAAGWVVHATYLLPDADWAAYYDPLAARIEQLRAEGVDGALLDQVGEEVAVRAAHAGDYGYTGYVLRPR